MDVIEIETRTGLKEKDIILLKEILFSNAAVEDAVIYGSRAKGCWKPFSDIDITLIGENITHSDLIGLMMKFEDSALPYMVDLNIFSSLSNPALRDHIARVGISLR
ncbi:MAG: nucleotidyltransferase domain-containing protein [Bacteroides sp.]|nr:nucleotidyltransferase domain-containing protein [Bacteroides sp.]MBD5348029.1 nucleotidyltransferase domain-containing protein [Bacteroides sp.]